MTLLRRLQTAFKGARDKTTDRSHDRDGNQKRSKAWVEQMAEQFRKVYQAPGQAVFSRDFDGNHGYCVNELLFDVLVCDTTLVTSPVHKVKLPATTRAIWVVESEFSDNARDVVFDFGKLAIAKAPYKLMVIADPSRMLQPLTECVAAAAAADPDSTEHYYLARLPHPNDWSRSGEAAVHLSRYAGNGVWETSDGPNLAVASADGGNVAVAV